MSALRQLFENYYLASSKSTVETAPPPIKVYDGIDSMRFLKVCKDGKLFNRTFRTNDVDVIFTKYKIPGQRRMDYRGFKEALEVVAIKRGESMEQTVAKLLETTAGTPSISGTEALPNRFHDDKSLYTNLHKEGGPTNVDREKMAMSQLCDRFKKATVRGTPLCVAVGPGILQQQLNEGTLGSGRLSFTMDDYEQLHLSSDVHTPNSGSGPRRGSAGAGLDNGMFESTPLPVDKIEPLRRVFEVYQMSSSRSADLGPNLPPPPIPIASGIDSARLLKLCKDADLFNRLFRINDVDILFTKHKIKGQRKMAWKGFKAVLAEIAIKREDSFEALIDRVVEATSLGPKSSGTEALPNRFHDDKSLYTNLHKEGGPTNVDREKMTMSQLCDRFKKATVRGTPLCVAVGPGILQQQNMDMGTYAYNDTMSLESVLPPMPPHNGGLEVPLLTENTLGASRPDEANHVTETARESIQRVYEDFSRMSRGIGSASKVTSQSGVKEEGLDGTRFHKLCQESQLFGRQFRPNDVDIIFTKYKTERKLLFDGFMVSLYDISVKKNVSLMEVVDQVVFANDHESGVANHFISGTIAERNRFYDDRNTWTGVAATTTTSSSLSGGATEGMPVDASQVEDLKLPSEMRSDLERVYGEYAFMSRAPKDRGPASAPLSSDDGMDSARFLKLCNDARLFDGLFRLQDVDVIFAKSKVLVAKDARKLNFIAFCSALVEVCKKKKTGMDTLVDAIVHGTAGGPHISGTVAEANRFHDDKTTYTGVKAHGESE